MPSATRTAEIAANCGTGNLARQNLGAALTLLGTAYQQVSAYDPGASHGLGLEDAVSAIFNATPGTQAPDAQDLEYLDGIRTRAEADFAALQATDDPLDQATANQIAFDIASIEAATNQTMTLFTGTALGDLAASIRGALPTLPTPLGGYTLWIVIAAAIVVLYLWKK